MTGANRKLGAVWLSWLLVFAVLAPTVLFAGTTAGNTLSYGSVSTGNAPMVDVADGTLDTTTDSTIQVAYNVENVGTAPSDLALFLSNDGDGSMIDSVQGLPSKKESSFDVTIPADAVKSSFTLRATVYDVSGENPQPISGAADTSSMTVQYSGPKVTSSSVSHVSGTQPTMSDVSVDASFAAGLLQIQLKNDTAIQDANTEDDYELAGVGADDTTELRITTTVSNYVPRSLIGSAKDVTWTRTNNGDGTWDLTITGRPAAIQSRFENDGSAPTNWDGTLQANEAQDAAMTFAADDLGIMSQSYRQRLNGSAFMTDAQEFGSPTYDTSGANDAVKLTVSAPHFQTDGSVNYGYFDATLPAALLTHWGVTADELAGEFDGSGRSTEIETLAGGDVRVNFSVHYSEGDATVTVDSTAPTADAGSGYAATAGSSVTLDASSSADDQGIDTYEWDFDGDGTYDATGSSATATHTFNSAGDHTVTLRVTDGAGNADTDTATVSVSEGSPSGGSSGVSGGFTPPAPTTPDPEVSLSATDEGQGGEISVSNPSGTTEIAVGANSADGSLSFDGLTVGTTGGEDYTLGTRVADAAPAADRALDTDATGSEASLGYLVVEHSVPDADVSGVTFEFGVAESRLDARGVDPADVVLYRNHDGSWDALETASLGRADGRHRFAADSPGLSTFAIGTAASEPAIAVTDAAVSPGAVTAGDPVTVTATVENSGTAAGTHTVAVRADDALLAHENASLDAGAIGTVSIEHAFDQPGEYALSVDGQAAGTVTVQAADSEPETATERDGATSGATATEPSGTSGDGAGFGPVVAVLALLSVAALARRR